MNPSLNRNIRITNLLTIIFGGLNVIFLLLLILHFGWRNNFFFFVSGILACGLIYLLNYIRWYTFSRVLFCVMYPVMTLFINVYTKSTEGEVTLGAYYDPRFFLVAFSMLPFLVFSLSEKKSLIACSLLYGISLTSFDWIHNQYGVGFEQVGYSDPAYFYTTYVVLICYLIVSLGSLGLKTVIERTERKNEELIVVLNSRNTELEGIIESIENKFLNLYQSYDHLTVFSRRLIEKKRKTEIINKSLEHKLLQQGQDLVRISDQLIEHHHELNQFSSAVSHQLKAPVARVLGLANILTMENAHSKDGKQITEWIQDSAMELNKILTDLNQILNIRSSHFPLELIRFDLEYRDIAIALDLNRSTAEVDISFKAPQIYSVRSMIRNILFSILDNSLKFKSPGKNLILSVRTFTAEDNVVIEIRDNGIGFDAVSNAKDLFKMYKRFHDHTIGKGLGLYMVHAQVKYLGGQIEVSSVPDVGTSVSISLPQRKLTRDAGEMQPYQRRLIHDSLPHD